MPTVFTHAVAGAVAGQVLAPRARRRAVTLLAIAAALLPDVDVVGWLAGVEYYSLLGHRGLTHSLFFACVVAALAGMVWRGEPATPGRWRVAACIFAAAASHPLLDALTDGGYGVALGAPFFEERVSFPFTPIPVAPLRPRAMFSRWGALVLASEIVSVWIPTGLVVLVVRLFERWRRTAKNGLAGSCG